MKKKSNHWVQLLVKYWKGAITPVEKDELDRQRHHSPVKEFQFQHIRRLAWNLARLRDINAIDEEAGWQDVLRRVAPKTQTTILGIPKRRFYLAAALLAGIILYFANTRSWRQSETETAHQADILPPKNNAKLILYNGSVFLLEEKADGLITEDGVLKITKQGQELYVKALSGGNISSTHKNQLIISEGSTYKLYLPDGSSVYMNASSSIIFPSRFTNHTREVDIRGEAYLEVSPNGQSPFMVNLNDKYDVKAVGTSFLVRSYPDEELTTVKLTTGELQINKTREQSNPKYVKPNQQFIADNKTANIIACSEPAADLAAWRDSSFNFNKDLKSILEDIEKWYKVKFSYPPNIDTIKLTGNLSRYKPLSETLNHLQTVTDLKMTRSGNTIIVK